MMISLAIEVVVEVFYSSRDAVFVRMIAFYNVYSGSDNQYEN